MNQLSLQRIPPYVRQICALLGVLIPVVFVEGMNQGRLNLWVLPFLAIGVCLGFQRHKPLWCGWWLSWFVVGIMNAWCFGPAERQASLFILWKPAVLLLVSFIAIALWQLADGFLTAFVLLPCTLEFPRLFLFNDLPAGDIGIFFLARGISILLYALAAITILGPSIHRRWWVLFSIILAQFATSIFLSYPIINGFIFFYPAFIFAFIFLAFGPELLGFILDGFRLSTTRWKPFGWMTAFSIILIGLFLPSITVATFSPSLPALTVSPTAKQQAIIIDTDMSNDDIAAILFLLHRPELDIRAISVVNGVAHVKPGVENARRLLALAGRKDIQVAGGPDEPLAGDRSFPESWRSSLDLSSRPALPSVPPSATELSAPQLILQQVNRSPEPVRLIALGPLTNVALAIKMDATLPTKLEDIFISGGAIVVPGIIHEELPSNSNATAEWNLYIDPLAADQVFRSGARLALAPLDVTHTSGPHPLLLYPSFVDKFFASAARPDAQFMAAIMRNSQLMQTSPTPLNAIPLWDLAAAVIAVEPQVCTNWQDLALHLVLDPDNVAGQTIVEKGQPSNAHVCMGGDQVAFEKILTKPDITGSPSH